MFLRLNLADKTMAMQHGKIVQCKSWVMFILYFGDISDTRIYCLQKKDMFNTGIEKPGGYYMYFSTFEIYGIIQ